MAFKRSAVRSRLSPPEKSSKIYHLGTFSFRDILLTSQREVGKIIAPLFQPNAILRKGDKNEKDLAAFLCFAGSVLFHLPDLYAESANTIDSNSWAVPLVC